MNYSDFGLGILIGIITVVIMGMAADHSKHKVLPKEPEPEVHCPAGDTIPPPTCRSF